jgi:hypothetical protein
MVLADFLLGAMLQPMIGRPRRPQLMRVTSQVEADVLAATLAATGVRSEVLTPLDVLDASVEEMSTEFGGGARDYRTQATQAGEPQRPA